MSNYQSILSKLRLNYSWRIFLFLIPLLLVILINLPSQRLMQTKSNQDNNQKNLLSPIPPDQSVSSKVESTASSSLSQTDNSQNANSIIIDQGASTAVIYYPVVRVVDGDTIDVNIDGRITRIRLIGINTPEVVDPRRPVECFGREASEEGKRLLTGQQVNLAVDDSQDNQDKYGRLLRYVWRPDGLFYNLEMIKRGYAYEYTYHLPYQHQAEFKAAQTFAQTNKLGLWADDTCAGNTKTAIKNSATSASNSCLIKGNINARGEKIYHLPVCPYYQQTIIDESNGERWFCSEAEAIQAGWRKAQNCP